MKTLIGAHLSYTQDTQLKGHIEKAIEIEATSTAMYISKSRGYGKFSLSKEMVKEAHILAKNNKFNIENIIVHSPLVGNIASTDKEKNIFESTFKSYLQDLKDMNNSGIKYYNFHPGSNPEREKGIKQIAKGINKLHKATKNDNTVILLETMMAKGNYIGRSFEDLKEIIELVDNKERIGVCLDTCHVWDAGYDIKNNLDKVLKDFNKIIGLKYLKALHINDSKNELGSNKDRHEEIGKGYIGKKALIDLVNHPKLIKLPKALETPTGKESYLNWKKEIKLLRK